MLFNGIFHPAARRSSIRTKLLFVASTASLAITGSLALQGPALAQGASDNSESITVTASRVNRAGYEAPTPTTVVGPATLEAQALLNTADYVNNLPQMRPVQQSGNSRSIGGNRPDFRGLGPVRTLVLLDGVRVGYTDPLGGVDLNIMPTSLIQSIELVSGGASADWGSDAVAGVMNFHLANTLEGIKGTFQCGQSQYGDDQQCGGGVGVGSSFLGGKLHVVAAGDWLSDTGVMNAPGTRKWASHNVALLANPAYAAGNGQYRNILSTNSCYSGWTSSGLITGGPLKGITFTPQGQPEPFAYGQYVTTANPLYMQGGTCEVQFAMYITPLKSPLHHTNAYTRVTYDVSDNTSVYAEALYAHSNAFNQALANYLPGTQIIKIDNAYLPASLKAAMIQNNLTSFPFGRWEPDLGSTKQGTSLFEAEEEVNRYVAGAKGGIVDSWTWDAHVQYSRAQYISNLFGSQNNVKMALAADSLLSPTTGLPICRSTLTDPTNGCVPVNLFGRNAISVSARGYVGGTATGLAFYTVTAGAVNIQGEPIDLPAGPVSFAGGFETRTEHMSVTVDQASALTQWRYQGLNNQSGSNTVNEGYLEAVIPILKNMSFANNLDLNIAGRITDYSTSGEVETWKAGLNYTPFASGLVRFRGTLSVDIRAPTLNELFSTTIGNGSAFVTDYACGNCQVLVQQYTSGNPNLTPEVARTTVLGAVISPDFWGLDGLTMSADYYDIKISKGIISLNGQTTVTYCGLGITVACAGLVRNAAGTLTSVHAQYYNAQGLEIEGVDLEATYTKDLDEWFADVPGRLTLHSLFAYVSQNTTKNGTTVINNVGLTNGAGNAGGVPMWNGNLSAQYNINAWQFYLQANLVGGELYDKVDTLTNYGGNPFYRDHNHVSAAFYFNTTVQYQLNDAVQIYGGVDNLLNQGYPINAGANATTNSTVGGDAFHDIIGRRFKVGFRFKI